MTEDQKVKQVELYIFDDIDSRDIQLQDIDGEVGEIEVLGSVVKHRVYENNDDFKVMTETSINLKRVSNSTRFRYATEDNKSDGIGIILRADSTDFVFTSLEQDLSLIYDEIDSEL